MQPDLLRYILLASSVWGAAVFIKAVIVLRSNGSYVFSIWDGGLLRAGKTLDWRGTQIKAGVGFAASAGGIAILAHVVTSPIAPLSLMSVAFLTSLVSDLMHTSKSG